MAQGQKEFMEQYQKDEKFQMDFQQNPENVLKKFADIPENEKKDLLNAVKQGSEALEERLSKWRFTR